MQTEIAHTLSNQFEAHAKKMAQGVEFWLAQDIQTLLGYGKWGNFFNVICKAT